MQPKDATKHSQVASGKERKGAVEAAAATIHDKKVPIAHLSLLLVDMCRTTIISCNQSPHCGEACARKLKQIAVQLKLQQ